MQEKINENTEEGDSRVFTICMFILGIVIGIVIGIILTLNKTCV